MIVRATDDSGELQLVTQPDHAALAARLMSAWQRDAFPALPRRDLVLLATERHDDGWIEVDEAPLVGRDGRVLDFTTAPEEVRLAIWPRAVRRLAREPYVAALVAQHALQIHEPRSPTSPPGFFDEMETSRGRCLAEAAPLDIDDLLSDYFFVRMGDTLSLVFCNGWTEPRRLAQYEIRLEGSRLVVDPDPFGGREIPLSVPARTLPDRLFTPDEASIAFAAARVGALTGVASGPAPGGPP